MSTPEVPGSFLDLPGFRALSAEARVVLLLASLTPSNEAQTAAAALARSRGFRWEAALALAGRVWVRPLLAHALLTPGSPLAGLPPTAAVEDLRLVRSAAQIRWESYQSLMGPVLERWAEAGIEATLLKGASHQATIFPPGTRMLNDMDLWVPPDTHEAAAAYLLEMGFTRSAKDMSLDAEDRARMAAWTFHKTGVGVLTTFSVDLHRALFDPDFPFTLSVAACNAAGSRVSLAGHPARVFNREDAVVLTACHLMKEMVVKLQTVADLVALLTPGPDGTGADFADVESRARESGAEGPTVLALRWARAGGAPVPSEVIHRLEAACPRARPSLAAFLDARALVPGFRMRAAAGRAMRGSFRPRQGSAIAPYTETLATVLQQRSRVGAPSPGMRLAVVGRTLILVAFGLAVARLAAAFAARRASRWVERLNGILWTGREAT